MLPLQKLTNFIYIIIIFTILMSKLEALELFFYGIGAITSFATPLFIYTIISSNEKANISKTIEKEQSQFKKYF